MQSSRSKILVLGATGRTGRHFMSLALEKGHTVRALTRDASKMEQAKANPQWVQGSITEELDMDALLHGIDAVVIMLGDAKKQQEQTINTLFMQKLIPAMRKHGVRRLLYQAGGFTAPYPRRLPVVTWILKNTVVRRAGLLGQHRDNEAVIEYLTREAQDIDWIVHRACIVSDGLSKGALQRHRTKFSLATFEDCAAYNYMLLQNDSAIHTCDLSRYAK
ncbi:NAD(P)-dependent oxidoreductase [Saccharibacillus sacchari]|uniref:NAD(P)H-binding protein n=1 Tax=Saccharibacillus sacchari TaxID=456493 RepID=A0ACC6PDW4_9BACL